VIETATAYQKLRDQFNLSLEQIGARVGGKSVSAVSNTLRLLRLPKQVKEALAEGKVSEGQVRPLIGLDDNIIQALLPQIIREGWSARQVEQHITDIKKSGIQPKAATKEVTVSPYVSEIRRISTKLSTDISVQSNARGAGKITIRFKDEKEFEKIKSILDK
jgi:ParB family chromosome partitioning protein